MFNYNHNEGEIRTRKFRVHIAAEEISTCVMERFDVQKDNVVMVFVLFGFKNVLSVKSLSSNSENIRYLVPNEEYPILVQFNLRSSLVEATGNGNTMKELRNSLRIQGLPPQFCPLLDPTKGLRKMSDARDTTPAESLPNVSVVSAETDLKDIGSLTHDIVIEKFGNILLEIQRKKNEEHESSPDIASKVREEVRGYGTPFFRKMTQHRFSTLSHN
ncbi:hypothetical protein TNCV_376551 [Trichonephila clavipes]|nr:hypothetical protein TNCV_376551 [Trichonephila clavipes]